jgi:histone H3
MAVRKPYRLRSGTQALREIKAYQRSTGLLIPKTAFKRVVREVAADFATNWRFTEGTMDILQEAAESFVVSLFEEAQLYAIHAGRITIAAEDLKLVMQIKKRGSYGGF